MTTTTQANRYPDVAPPAGAKADAWEGDTRTVYGPERELGDYGARIYTAAAQLSDGRIDVEGVSEAPNVYIVSAEARGMTSAQARRLAALILEAADEIDGWAKLNGTE